MDFVKTELMPDFDFDAFNHEEDPNGLGQGVRASQDQPENSGSIESSVSVEVAHSTVAPEIEIDPSSITEKKPLEAKDTPASQGDNMSQEEVEKW